MEQTPTPASRPSLATLGSSGTFSGPVTTGTGPFLSPGAAAGAIGTLAINDATGSALTLNSSNLLVDLSTGSNDLIAVTGNTVLNGTNTVFPNLPTGVAAGTYTLMSYAATTGTGSVLFPNGTTTLGNATLAVNGTNIQMSVAAGGLNNSVWQGTSGTWDSGTNWNRNGTASSAFVAGDFVTFDDTGTTLTVTSAAPVSPTYVLANNSTKTYVMLATIGGTGTPLVKTGTGTFTLGSNIVAPANTLHRRHGDQQWHPQSRWRYKRQRQLPARRRCWRNHSEWRSVEGNQYQRQRFQDRHCRVCGWFAFVNKNNNFTTTGILTGSGTLNLLDGGGSGTLSTYNFNSTANDFTGGIVLNNAIVSIARLDDSSNNIVFNAGSTTGLAFRYGSTATTPLNLSSRTIEFNSSVLSSAIITNNNTTQAITIGTNLVATGAGEKTLTLDAVAGPTNAFIGNITNGTGGGTVAVTKSGAGLWILSGSNSYTGATTISTGTLAAIGINAFGSTSGISLTGTNTIGLHGDARRKLRQFQRDDLGDWVDDQCGPSHDCRHGCRDDEYGNSQHHLHGRDLSS